MTSPSLLSSTFCYGTLVSPSLLSPCWYSQTNGGDPSRGSDHATHYLAVSGRQVEAQVGFEAQADTGETLVSAATCDLGGVQTESAFLALLDSLATPQCGGLFCYAPL